MTEWEEWLDDKEPLTRLIARVFEADRLLDLSINGIRSLGKTADFLARLVELDFPPSESTVAAREEKMSKLRGEAELARQEVDRGFPALHANTLIAIWGALESAIVDYVVQELLRDPALLGQGPLTRIKMSLGDLHTLPSDEIVRRALYEAELNMKSRLGPGVARFEALLGCIPEMTEAIDDEVSKTIYEIYHVRNVLVHRSGIVDRRFVESCSWTRWKVGNTLLITRADFGRYRGAILAYIESVVRRAADRKERREQAALGGAKEKDE